MVSDISDIWQAMKETKYRNVLNELKELHESENNLEEVLKKTLDIVVIAMGAETGIIWFYDYFDTNKIYPRIVYGKSVISDTLINPEEGVVGSVIKTKNPELISNYQDDSRILNIFGKDGGFVAKTMVCVPLGDNDDETAFGAIQIINKKDGELYDKKDLEFASLLAKEITKLFISLSTENIIGIRTKKQRMSIDFNTIFGFRDIEKVEESLIATMRDSNYNRPEIEKVVEYAKEIYKIISKNNI